MRPTKKDIIHDYFESTSIDGLGKIYSTKLMPRRVFWIAIFLIIFGLFVRAVVGLFTKVLSNGTIVTVETKTSAGAIDFPMITICNAVPYAASKTKSIKTVPFTDAADRVHRYYDLYWQLREQAGGSEPVPPFLDYRIVSATFNSEPCDIGTCFTNYTTWTSGLCYVFNNKSVNVYKQSRPGLYFGLVITLGINQLDYDLDIPNSQHSAGILVSVSHGEPAFPFLSGIAVAPGEYTRVALTKATFNRLKHPYKDNCTDEIKPRLFRGRYTTEVCQVTCYIIKENQFCGATDPFLYSSVHFRESLRVGRNTSELECLGNYSKVFHTDKFPCSCFPPCHEDVFDFTLSHSNWPSNSSAGNVAATIANSSKFFEDTTADNIRNNFLTLAVYFDDFAVQEVTGKERYGWSDFSSDLGGEAGLWMGASVFSVIELGAFLLALLFHSIKGRKGRTRDQRQNVKVGSDNHVSMSSIENSPA